MTQWTAEKRTELHKTFGTWTMCSERDGSETAYLLTHEDGRSLRVLPDSHNSVQRRSRVIVEALKGVGRIESVWSFEDDELGDAGPIPDQMPYLVGCFTIAGLTWEMVSTDDPLHEWLAKWFVDVDLSNPELPKYLVDDLDHAGWVVVVKGEG